MSRRLIAVLSVSIVGWMGCATPGARTMQSRDGTGFKVEDAAVVNAREETAPAILPGTYFAAAQLFEHQGLTNRALIQYRKAIAADPSYAEAHHRLGVLLGRAGRHEEATKALEHALQLRRDDPSLRNDLGFEYALQARWSDAQRELERALELKPGFARAYVNLGMVLCNQERFDEGLDMFRVVLPEPDAQYNLGLLLRGRHRYHDAATAFETALKLSPAFTAASTQLAQIAPRLEFLTPLEPVTQTPTRDTPPVQVAALSGTVPGMEEPIEALPQEDSIRLASAVGPTYAWLNGLRRLAAEVREEILCWEMAALERDLARAEAFKLARGYNFETLAALAGEIAEEIYCRQMLEWEREMEHQSENDAARNATLGYEFDPPLEPALWLTAAVLEDLHCWQLLAQEREAQGDDHTWTRPGKRARE